MSTRLRTALDDIAAEAAPPADLWSRLVARRAVRRRRARAAYVAAAVAVAVALVALVTAVPRRAAAPPVRPVPESPLRWRVTASEHPGGLAVSPTAVWTTDFWAGELVRVDRATHAVTRYPLPGGGGLGLAYSGNSLWTGRRQVLQVDEPTGHVRGPTKAENGDAIAGITRENVGGAWVASEGAQRTVWHLGVEGEVLREYELPVDLPFPGIVATSAIWVVAAGGGPDGTTDVVRIDRDTGDVTLHPVPYRGGGSGGHVGATNEVVWVESGKDLLRLDPETAAVTARVTLGEDQWVTSIVGWTNEVWVASYQNNAVYRIDDATATVLGSFGAPKASYVYPSRDAVWVVGEGYVAEYDPAAVVGDLP